MFADAKMGIFKLTGLVRSYVTPIKMIFHPLLYPVFSKLGMTAIKREVFLTVV